MELFKKIYYPKKYRVKKLIFLPLGLIIMFLLLLQTFTEQTPPIIQIMLLICVIAIAFLLFLAIEPVLAFSSDSVYFYKQRILFGEIESIKISETGKLILFTLRQKNNKSWLIDCKQTLFDPQMIRFLSKNDFKLLAATKHLNKITLYNTLGFDTPLEEILSCFPSNIPIIEDKE